MDSVYSFSDVSLVISDPSVGRCVITGQGVGSVSISRSDDMTQHDRAADGSVMTSKIVSEAGTLAISIQQTSAAHLWLKKWLAYKTKAPTKEWATTSAVLKFPAFDEQISMTGISPQKRADASYQAAGQQVTWNLMCAKITG